jgi:hypothetical protein
MTDEVIITYWKIYILIKIIKLILITILLEKLIIIYYFNVISNHIFGILKIIFHDPNFSNRG